MVPAGSEAGPEEVFESSDEFGGLPGVAVAPEQLDFAQRPDCPTGTPVHLNTSGTLFYQGLTMSAEFTW